MQLAKQKKYINRTMTRQSYFMKYLHRSNFFLQIKRADLKSKEKIFELQFSFTKITEIRCTLRLFNQTVMTDNSNQTFTEDHLAEETASLVYEHSEDENSSTTASTNFSEQNSFGENDLQNESITNENLSVKQL